MVVLNSRCLNYCGGFKSGGSKWSVGWRKIFSRLRLQHIADFYYFDDHSTQGIGITYNKNLRWLFYFPEP